MKISRKRLIEIIKEEITREEIKPIGGEVPQKDQKQPNPEQEVKALGQFSARLMKASKDIRGVKGLDTTEMTEILDIFQGLVKFASAKSGGTLMRQLSALIAKKTGIEQ